MYPEKKTVVLTTPVRGTVQNLDSGLKDGLNIAQLPRIVSNIDATPM